MIVEFSIFIFILSLLGMGGIFVSSFSRLSEVEVRKRESILKTLKERLKERFSFKNLKKEVLLEKILRKIRILNLKLDVKISNQLQNIVQRRLESLKKEEFWEKLRKRKKDKNRYREANLEKPE